MVGDGDEGVYTSMYVLRLERCLRSVRPGHCASRSTSVLSTALLCIETYGMSYIYRLVAYFQLPFQP